MALLITDPVTLLLDADGDIDMENGFQLETGLDAVVTGVQTRLRLIRGEWFADLDAGVPWLENDSVTKTEAVLGKPFDEAKVRAVILEQIYDTPGIKDVTALTVVFDGVTRECNITWQANTLFGDTGVQSG